MRYGPGVQLHLGKLPPPSSKMINGKWLIGCESSRRFVVHDLDSRTVPHLQQVLWEHDAPIHGWCTCTVISSDGPVLYILLYDATDDGPFSPRYVNV